MARLSNWKTQFLSQAGKEVLLKSIIQAIPAYYCMGLSKLSKQLINELNKAMKNIWFEATWLLKDECVQTIKEAWEKAAGGEDFTNMMRRRLLNCRSALKNGMPKKTKGSLLISSIN